MHRRPRLLYRGEGGPKGDQPVSFISTWMWVFSDECSYFYKPISLSLSLSLSLLSWADVRVNTLYSKNNNWAFYFEGQYFSSSFWWFAARYYIQFLSFFSIQEIDPEKQDATSGGGGDGEETKINHNEVSRTFGGLIGWHLDVDTEASEIMFSCLC